MAEKYDNSQVLNLYNAIGKENPTAKQYLDQVIRYVSPDKTMDILNQLAKTPKEDRDAVASSFKEQYYPGYLKRAAFGLEDVIKLPKISIEDIASGVKGFFNFFFGRYKQPQEQTETYKLPQNTDRRKAA